MHKDSAPVLDVGRPDMHCTCHIFEAIPNLTQSISSIQVVNNQPYHFMKFDRFVFIVILSLVKTTTLVSATDAPTKSPTAPPTVYAGTSKWYVSYEDQVCKQDCEVADGSECGGITRDSFTIANGLYATAGACCSARLSYLDVNYCEDRSLATPVGTDMYYAKQSDGYCVQDTGDTMATVTDKLYDGADACCSGAMSWIPSVYCTSRSEAVAADRFSDKWFGE
jgi:hypothetical protein